MFDIQEVKRNMSKWSKGSEEQDNSATPDQERHTQDTRKRKATSMTTSATIGPSIQIKGELSGEENLIIDGKIEGTIDLKDNDLTIGSNGRIDADVFARTIVVDGQLRGDMHGKEKVIIRQSGNVHGNIVAPRVTLEDGAKFKGSIDMDPTAGAATSQQKSTSTAETGSDKTKPSSDTTNRKSA